MTADELKGTQFFFRKKIASAFICAGIDLAENGVPSEFTIVSLLHVTSIEPVTNRAA
jgi:hypothetical protein